MNKFKLKTNERYIEIGCLDEEKQVIAKWEELTCSKVEAIEPNFGYPRTLAAGLGFIRTGEGDVKASEWLARFEEEIKYYKLRDNFKDYDKAAGAILGCTPEWCVSTVSASEDIEILKKAGVLDIWFEPVYRKEVYKVETDFGKHHARIAINDNVYEFNSENIHEFLHLWMDNIADALIGKEVGSVIASIHTSEFWTKIQIGNITISTNHRPRIDTELHWLIGVISSEFNLNRIEQ